MRKKTRAKVIQVREGEKERERERERGREREREKPETHKFSCARIKTLCNFSLHPCSFSKDSATSIHDVYAKIVIAWLVLWNS